MEKQNEKTVITTEAAKYTLIPGENVLLELKVKQFGDNGAEEITVESSSKNPLTKLLGSLFGGLQKKAKDAIGKSAQSGLFVVTSHRCFIAKSTVAETESKPKKKSFFCILLAIGITLAIIGLITLPTGQPAIIIGIILCACAFITKGKRLAQFAGEYHEFITFPRNALTEYNGFTCQKELFGEKETGCCSKKLSETYYKTVLTVELKTITSAQKLELVLDPEQVSNHEQALVLISKLAELAQKAN